MIEHPSVAVFAAICVVITIVVAMLFSASIDEGIVDSFLGTEDRDPTIDEDLY